MSESEKGSPFLSGGPYLPVLLTSPHTSYPREFDPFRRSPSPSSPIRRATSPALVSGRASPSLQTIQRRSAVDSMVAPLKFRSRRRLLHLVACLAIFCILGAVLSIPKRDVKGWIAPPEQLTSFSTMLQWPMQQKPAGKASLGALRMEGQKSSFKTNLRTDKKYLTAWYHAGWTNDVIMCLNMLYLAKLTGRIPIIPAFPPDNVHLQSSEDVSGFLAFSHIFDLPRLARVLNMPMVEFHELKSMSPHTAKLNGVPGELLGEPPEDEDIGCWSTWLSQCENGCKHGRGAREPGLYKLNIHYTPIPPALARKPYYASIPYENLTNVAKPAPNPFISYYLASNELQSFAREHDFPVANPQPDEQVACFDMLYYVSDSGDSVDQEYTGRTSVGKWGGAWGAIGRYARWNPNIEEIAKGYLRRAFHVPDRPNAPVPPFIGVHIRRGDFRAKCPHDKPKCLPTIADYGERLDWIKGNLTEKFGSAPEHVLMTTDEEDKGFLYEAIQAGWTIIDHGKEKTIDKYGQWYPTLLDSVFLSMGKGFLGTSASTLSILARRRVEDWNDGYGLLQPIPGGMGPTYDD